MRSALFKAAGFAVLTATLAAQPAPPAPSRPVLVNKGEPLRVSFACTGADIEAYGLHCTAEEPCRVFLELAAVAAAGSRIFLAGNLHTESVTLESIVLASQDAGQSWQEPFERIRGASLDRIQLLDNEHGWIAGQIVQPLPRDPFFLITGDGGLTWRRRPVFSEPRPGAVERFSFTSATEGVLWIDRSSSGEPEAAYERYETTTGGESWSLREARRRLPPAPPGEDSTAAGWRLTVDPQTSTYNLERETDGRWVPAARFEILAGECSPQPAPPVEPPPEQTEAAPAKVSALHLPQSRGEMKVKAQSV